MFSRKALAIFLASSLVLATTSWAQQYGAGATADETVMVGARRERNLDHWDSDTLAYYLDEYAGYDIAVMFYAQRDQNSHALAPYWDRIATILEAGSSESRLIMSLFNCELNTAHFTLCEAANIESYPTLMFIGSGPYHDTDPVTRALFGSKAAGIMGNSPIPNTVKFQGNWQYGDAILDWIRTMQALSNWHTWTTKGFGKRLRNFFLPHATPKTSLPVGIPGGTPSSSSAPSDSLQVKNLKSEVSQLKAVKDEYEKVAFRQSNFLGHVLSTSKVDMFAKLNEEKCWNEPTTITPQQAVLKDCVKELSLDYCQRISNHIAYDMIDEMERAGLTLEDILALSDVEQQIGDRISLAEPYCMLLDICLISDFAEPECKPETCPFNNEAACRYLTACLDPSLQEEYAEALGLSLTAASASAGQPEATAEQSAATKKKWGL